MFGRRHRTAVVLLLAAALALPGVAKAQYLVSTSGSLTMASDPGDWVGAGGSYSLSTPGDTFFAHSDGTTVDLRVGSWMLRFAAPAGEPLVPGTYTSALRAAFPRSGTPGLDVSGNGHGCNTLTGSFTVYDASYGPYGYLESFHASFEQHCEGGSTALRGEVAVVDPPAPPPLAVHIAVDPLGVISRPDGSAVVHGTLTCSQVVRGAYVGLTLDQDTPRGPAHGQTDGVLDCGPAPTPWTATVGSWTVPFRLGPLAVAASNRLLDPFYSEYTGYNPAVFGGDSQNTSVFLLPR